MYTDTLPLSCFLFLSLASHGEHLNLWDLFYRVSSEKPDERVRNVRQRLDWLMESVNWCLTATNEIVRCHAQFAYMMARRINGASDFDNVMEELARDMATASTSLSQRIGNLKSDLAKLVSVLEEMEVKKKQSTTQRILGWLEVFLNGLAEVFSYGPFVVPLLPPQYGLGMIQIVPSLSCLYKEAAKLCKKASGGSRGMPHTPHSGGQNE